MRLSSRTLVAALALASATASAHARLNPAKSLKPRSTSSSLKDPNGPCGNVAATSDPANRTVLEAGQDLVVEWQETVNHSGSYTIDFSPDGTTGYDDNVLKNVVDTQNGSVTFGDEATWHTYSATIKVPEALCEACSIRLVQLMENSTNYYSCADVRIVAPGTVDDPPPAGPATPEDPTDPTAEPTPGADTPANGKPAAPTGLTVKAVETSGKEGGDAKSE